MTVQGEPEMKVNRTDEGGVTVVEVEGTIKLGESAQVFARELQDVFARSDFSQSFFSGPQRKGFMRQ